MKTTVKSLFQTPRKAALSIACLALALALLCAGSAYAVTATAKNSAIGEEAAQNYAFVDAGVDPAAAQDVWTEFEFEAGQFVYEVDFIADGVEYDYWIKASDGSVVKKESQIISLEEALAAASGNATDTATSDTDGTADASGTDDATDADATSDATSTESTGTDNAGSTSNTNTNANSGTSSSGSASSSNSSSGSSSGSSSSTSSKITLDKAKQIALADAGVSASSATFQKAASDYEDGVAVYDIEFTAGNVEYEYEIKASNGDILSKSTETLKSSSGTSSGSSSSNSGSSTSSSSNSSSTSTSSSSDYISVDKAKSIALNKAGLSASEVTFTKAKLDRDDGVVEYEIEFYKGKTEYEVTINATTGAIIDYEVDVDD